MVAEGAYFLLLTAFFMALVTYRSERPGFILALLSLLPPTAITAKHYGIFASWFYEFFRGNIQAYVALMIIMFIVLLGLFYSLDLCKEEFGVFCVATAFCAAAVGCILLFLHLAAGGLAVSYAVIHYVTTGALYSIALKIRSSKLSRSVYIQQLFGDLRSACLESDASRALGILERLERVLPDGSVRREVKEAASYLKYLLQQGNANDVQRALSSLRSQVEEWEAHLL